MSADRSECRSRRMALLFLAALFWLLGLTPLNAQERLVIHATEIPPYVMPRSADDRPGVDVEVIRAAFDRVGITAVVRRGPWARAIDGVRHGTVAGALQCRAMPERLRFAIFTDPVNITPPVFIMRRDFEGPRPRGIADLVDYRVITGTGWFAAEILEGRNIPHELFGPLESGLRVILAGRADVLFGDCQSLMHQAEQQAVRDALSFILPEDPVPADSVICMSRQWPQAEELVARFNRGLRAIRRDGTYDRIHARYASEDGCFSGR